VQLPNLVVTNAICAHISVTCSDAFAVFNVVLLQLKQKRRDLRKVQCTAAVTGQNAPTFNGPKQPPGKTEVSNT